MKNPFLITVSVLSILFVACSSDDDSSDTPTLQDQDPVVQTIARTEIPDPIFEEFLVSRNLDDVVDGSVITQNLVSTTELILDDLGISNLEGIQDFPNLSNLWLQNNNVSVLDVSQNVNLQFLYADNNNLTEVDVSNFANLEKLSLRNNNISAIDLSDNLQLQLFEANGNSIAQLDVSNNPELNRLDVLENPLTCIKVSSEQLENIPVNWNVDPDDSYALDCE